MSPPAYTKPGFMYRRMEQHGPAAIYKQTHTATGRAMAYELLIVQHTVRDTLLPGGRILPRGTPGMQSAEEWGRLGWTVPTLAAARAIIAARALAGRTAGPWRRNLAA